MWFSISKGLKHLNTVLCHTFKQHFICLLIIGSFYVRILKAIVVYNLFKIKTIRRYDPWHRRAFRTMKGNRYWIGYPFIKWGGSWPCSTSFEGNIFQKQLKWLDWQVCLTIIPSAPSSPVAPPRAILKLRYSHYPLCHHVPIKEVLVVLRGSAL